ncbi:MAG: hypothetical protein ACJ742_09640, partial [Actinomycetes bacterium]
MRLHPRTRTVLAWLLWLATMACCAAGLVVTLFVTRPLTAGVLLSGAAFALAFPLGYATIGLVMTLRRPANPIGWLFAASGLVWSVTVPFDPWVDQLILTGHPLPLPALLVPDGRLRSRRWRPVVAAAVAGPVLGLLGSIFMPGKLEESAIPIDNPFGRTGMAGTVAAVVAFTGLGLWFISMLAAVLSLVLRFPGLPRDRAPAAALGRCGGHRRGGRAGGGDRRRGGDLLRGHLPAPRGGRGRAALPAVGPGPPGQ